ncbi:MAG: MerR family transcriptional regulator [Flavobacteriales bacterium]|jgi:DNA-binding transcriptional MerR regulator|nr:MerR family transcriptional regulator [Flavobacteriales bacterium]
MSVKTQFSIKDLENLSGIKAHTIRIWEKRYNLLEPERSNTNIRSYNLYSLMKLLNVTYLYNAGHKISKIAKLNPDKINELIQEMGLDQTKENFAVTEMKVAMLNFDQYLFNKTYFAQLKNKTFKNVFFEVFIPLLNDIGLLWQTGTIDPSHERFISELIKQKLIINIEKESTKEETKKDKLFVLFLPYDEIHEIGLLYLNYEIIESGYKTVYLGNNIPIESLHHLLNHHEKIIFVSYFTVQPEKHNLHEYINDFNKSLCKDNKNELWMLGNQIHEEEETMLPARFKYLKKLSDFIALL